MNAGTARLYFETARHLQVRQVLGWAAERLAGPLRVASNAVPPRPLTGQWIEGYLRPPSMLANGRVSLLNQDGVVGSWNDPSRDRLWTYHLHYFEDPFVSPDWILRWIAENPLCAGAGWEPYPLSRRIVNWIRWTSRFAPPAGFNDSLAEQTRALVRQVEYRLLANHLFANAKALLYAGTYFDGPEAAAWRTLGLKILDHEVKEQILADGGHCERSPMYHALILEDLLDLESLRQAYPQALPARPAWAGAIGRMLGWLRMMTHPDGNIAFFQDACFGVAGSYADLAGYAARLGFNNAASPAHHSHYRRLEAGDLIVLFDAGGPAPDYQPGHAHAGALSIEASWGLGRVIVNSGTSTYRQSPVRDFERSTEAHATVRVDGRNSSEMWGSFRVARRARVRQRQEGPGWVEAEHTGYAPARHRRRVSVSPTELTITDSLTGGQLLEWFFPLHPSIEVRGLELWRAAAKIGRLLPPAGVDVSLERAEWRPEFNRRTPSSRIRLTSHRPGEYTTRFCFEAHE